MYLVFRTLFVASLLTTVSFGLAACNTPIDDSVTPVEESAAEESAAMEEGALAAVVLKDWEDLKTAMMEFGDAMPAENFDFKPTDELRSFGEQLMHVASAHLFYMGNLDTDAARPDLGEPVEKADVLQALSDSFDFGTEILSGQTDASLREMVDGGYLGESNRARIAYQAMIHTRQEYGVMTVYLRLNDIVPPASR
ncbi:MAG: DinB family protein [Vicinamibacterales bacterium]|nr:DinB family protein [Vicinamibacterales bacterium]